MNREKESTFGLNTIRLGARGYNPTIGRFDEIDPIIEGQEHLSLYQYGWNNPVLRSDPNGDCPDCPPNILANMYFGVKHAIENTALRLAGSDYRADYKVVNGEQVYATEFKKIAVDKSIGGQLRETANAVLDVASIPMSATGNPAALLAKTGSTQIIKVAKEGIEEVSKSTKLGGKITEPNLPSKVIAEQDGIKAVHYTKSGDHGPPHVHVIGGGMKQR